jgi:beta-glucosidase
MSESDINERVRDLLGRMTLEEKVGQTVQYSSRKDMTGPAGASSMAPAIEAGEVGSLLNVFGAAETRKWQTLAMEHSRLHIPLLFGMDVVHGFRTIFPIPIASAASWDPELVERAERVAATEAAAAGIRWTFAPMVDVARDPRWGRIMESSGEDPYLGAAMARARVRGFQGSDLSAPDSVLACAKHFAGYGAVQAGREYNTTDLSDRVLRDVHLPPFKAAVDAGAGSVMAAFTDLDGTPCTGNAFLLRHLLRGELGFRGFVVSDWRSVDELCMHGVAKDQREAARLSLEAGVDMDMESEAYRNHLCALVRAGGIPLQRVDEAAGLVLAAKFRLGLFENPFLYSEEKREAQTLLKPEFLDLARDVARRSCVLLKNDGVLPLSTAGLRIALVGPLADAPGHQLGSWRALGAAADSITLRTALAGLYPNGHFTYAPGCRVLGEDTAGFSQALEAAERADVIIAAVGEDSDQSGEAKSRTNLDLSGPQLELLRALHRTGKPLVVVLMSGRPLLLGQVEPLASAILMAWHPGTMGGPAIADVLTGACNPSGRLPFSWPRSVGQIPLFYSHKPGGRPHPLPSAPEDPYYSRYIDSPSTPQYPFGYGLSYTTFAFDSLALSSEVLRLGRDPLRIRVRVSNTGPFPGEEVVQLYLRDCVGSVTRPVRELKGFRKVLLAKGESREVEFELRAEDLAFWRADQTWAPEPGEFEVWVGGDSTAELQGRFRLE